MARVVRKRTRKRTRTGASKTSQVSPLRPRLVPKQPPCQVCPNDVDIRTVLRTIADGEKFGRSFDESCEMAWNIMTEKNPMPAICGRLCLHPCESKCNRKQLEGAVGINSIEVFLGDFGIARNLKFVPTEDEGRDEKVAVVGSGPAGLSCAYQLARRGYPVTVFDSASQAGGKLRDGFFDDQLPRGVLDAEIDRIFELGIDLKLNTAIGQDISLEDLKHEYKAIFIEIGDDGADSQLGLELDADRDGRTAHEGVFAGRDKGLISSVLARGRRAAVLMDAYVSGEEPPVVAEMPVISADKMKLEHYGKIERLDLGDSLTEAQVLGEANRCMSCGYCFDCERCFMYCPNSGIRKPANKGELYTFQLAVCTGCGICVEQCPCGFLEMV